MQDTIDNLEWEIWKDIPGYEGRYMVSNLWRIYSCTRNIEFNWWIKFVWGNILSQRTNKWWYKCITISNWIIKKSHLIHRLVASAFLWLDLGSYSGDKTSLCVCHKDDRPSNNKLDNLFIWTHMENTKDKVSKWRQLKWKDNPCYWRIWINHPMATSIIQYEQRWVPIKEWDCIINASASLWINNWNIGQCCKWKLNTAWWYKWAYSNDKKENS